MHIFLTEKASGLAMGFLSYAQGIRGLRCSVYEGDPNDAVELQRQLTDAGPDFVVNTLQFDDLNLVEQSPDRAWQLNAILPDHLAHICLTRWVSYLCSPPTNKGDRDMSSLLHVHHNHHLYKVTYM